MTGIKYSLTDLSENITLGTWKTQSAKHYFQSKIGPWQFNASLFTPEIINDYLKTKPIKNQ